MLYISVVNFIFSTDIVYLVTAIYKS